MRAEPLPRIPRVESTINATGEAVPNTTVAPGAALRELVTALLLGAPQVAPNSSTPYLHGGRVRRRAGEVGPESASSADDADHGVDVQRVEPGSSTGNGLSAMPACAGSPSGCNARCGCRKM